MKQEKENVFSTVLQRTGLEMHNLDNLLKGKADIGTASKFGVITTVFQEFLDGTANTSMAIKLGLFTKDLQAMLDNSGGRPAAVGLALGFLLKKRCDSLGRYP
jgi:hypothetical protein